MDVQGAFKIDTKEYSPFFRSIRFQLLLAVNSVMFLMMLGLLAYDYQRELSTHFREKQSSLREEAKTLLPSIAHLKTHGPEAVQTYLDDVCGAMGDTDSHSHHIAVEFDGNMLQAKAHGCPKCNLGSQVKYATASEDWRFQVDDQEFLVGMHSRDGVSVFVSQSVTNIAWIIFSEMLLRMAGLILMGSVAAGIINFVLVRLVSRPLRQLVTQVREIGNGNFDLCLDGYGNTELDFLSSEIETMSARLAATEAERKSRLNKAREIQENLLPTNIKTAGLDIGTIYCPAEEVGGDYFDILPHGDNAWLICVADATGHGVPAAMSAAMLKTLLLQSKDHFESPADILREMNRVFMQVNLCEDFASMILLRIDLSSGQLVYANAGHDPAWLICSDGSSTSLAATGTLLGIIEDDSWEEVILTLPDVSRLAISTDGITEAFNSDSQQFGRDTLLSELVKHKDSPTSEVTEKIHQQIRKFRGEELQTDDVTLLLIDIQHPVSNVKSRQTSAA